MNHKNLDSEGDPAKSRVVVQKAGLLFKDPLSVAAKTYILSVILAGLATVVFCLYRSLANPDFRWLYLVGLTIVGSCIPVTIPWIKGKSQSLTITLGDVFVFSTILLFDPQTAAIVAAVEGLASSFRVKVKSVYKRLFNLAQLALVTFIVGQLFYRMEPGSFPAAAGPHSPAFFIRLAFCGFLYFVLNSAAVGFAISLATQQSFIPLWKQHFLSLSITNILNGTTAGIIVACLAAGSLSVVLALIPPILVFYHLRRLRTHQLQSSI
jgi:hypothetical protein